MKYVVLAMLAGFLVWACSSEKVEPELVPAMQNPSQLNPNGDSELALLMRSMTVYMETIRDSVQKEAPFPDCPTEFEALMVAKETEGMIKDRNHFNAYADQWLSDLNQVCTSTGGNRVKAYERLRSSCLNCHQSYCQGPIPKIQRLSIQNP